MNLNELHISIRPLQENTAEQDYASSISAEEQSVSKKFNLLLILIALIFLANIVCLSVVGVYMLIMPNAMHCFIFVTYTIFFPAFSILLQDALKKEEKVLMIISLVGLSAICTFTMIWIYLEGIFIFLFGKYI